MDNVMCKERVKQFEILFNKAKRNKSIGRFADECGINPKYMCQLLRNKASVFPNKDLLKNIAKNSNNTVTYNELLHVCGYKLKELQRVSYHKGDMFYVDLGSGVGSEQTGIRPAVVIQNDKGNLHSTTLIIAPLTSQSKNNLPTHVFIGQENGVEKPSTCMIEQMKVIDKQRVQDYIGTCNAEVINNINKACRIELQLDDKFEFKYAKNLVVQMLTLNNIKKKIYDNNTQFLEKSLKYNFRKYCEDHNKDYRIISNSIKNSLEIDNITNIKSYELKYA